MDEVCVTIGIPVYNCEKYIRQTLDSALAQSFESIEFLICDDCGTDDSIEIVSEYQSYHPRGKDIRVVHQPKNLGVAMARNRIIDEAQGRYLYFMDSDDVITFDCISILYQKAIEHQAEVVFGSNEKIEDNKISKFVYPFLIIDGMDKFAEYSYSRYGSIQAQVWNILYDIDILRSNSHKFINTNYWEDFVFTFDLVTFIKKAVLLPNITYSYICRANSLSNYQKRKNISKNEILRNVNTIEYLKKTTFKFLGKSYLGGRCYNIVMTDLYIICNTIKNRNIIFPSISDSELKLFMKHPLSIWQIFNLKNKRIMNLLLYFLSILPLPLFMSLVILFGKRKRLI